MAIKMIRGKPYIAVGAFGTKTGATARFKDYKGDGYKVRMMKNGQWWMVYALVEKGKPIW